MRALLVFAVLLLPLVACGGPDTTTEDPALKGVLDRATEILPGVRQLDFLEEVQSSFVTAEELADKLEEELDEEVREELAQLQELYRALGLIDPDLELFLLYEDLLNEQVIGLFDTETEELFVLTGRSDTGEAEELTLAHELTHALQQQHFDIDSLSEEVEDHLDQELALAALVEGDATLSEVLYLRLRDLPFPEVPDTPVLDNAPQIIQDTLIFPYLEGSEFVIGLWQRDPSWDEVNDAYAALPQSTEQILHFEKYLAGEAPLEVDLPDLLPALGDDWELVLDNVAGEFLLRSYLEEYVPTRMAERGAAGWGGDRFALYRDGEGRQALALLTRWDTVGEAQEFFEVYVELTDEAGWASRAVGASDGRWGRSDRWVYLSQAGDGALVILAPSEGIVDSVLAGFPGF